MSSEHRNGLLGVFHRACPLVYKAFSIFVIASLVLITCIIFYQVVMRDVFSAPPTWTEEIALVMMIYGGGRWRLGDKGQHTHIR